MSKERDLVRDTYYGRDVDLSTTSPANWSYCAPLDLRPMMCCGVQEVTSTPNTFYYSKERFLQWLEWRLLGVHGYGDSNMGRSGRKNPSTGILLATIAHNQKNRKEYEEWLLEKGFEDAHLEWYNHNTTNTVKMLIYRVPEELYKLAWKEPLSFPLSKASHVKATSTISII